MGCGGTQLARYRPWVPSCVGRTALETLVLRAGMFMAARLLNSLIGSTSTKRH
jgi:hypothetical protein